MFKISKLQLNRSMQLYKKTSKFKTLMRNIISKFNKFFIYSSDNNFRKFDVLMREK